MNQKRIVTGVLTALTVLALGVFTLSSCKHGETEIAVTGVTVSQPTLTLTEGETGTISYTVEPSDASIKDVTFTSSNPSVVTVDENGVVTAVGPGTAVITITTKDGSFKATVTVTVKAKAVAVTGVSLDKTELTLTSGETATLTATVTPEDAGDKSVTWLTSDAGVASVDENGVVTAGTPGSATITVKTNDGGKTATCAVTVEAKTVPVTGVTLDQSEITIEEGETITLTATVTPADATNKEVSWSSSDTSVATVEEGKVTGVKAGTTAVTVTTADGYKTASCKVTVKAKGIAVSGVTLDITDLTLVVGESKTLTATVKPSDATDKSVSWSSDKPDVATVDDSGKVEAKAAGEATVTVTTKDGGKTATCKVTVTAAEVKVTGVKLDRSSLTLAVGESETLVATVSPDDATNKEVTWSCNDISVAKVEEGKVTGIKAGTATIIATTKDGGYKATCAVTVTATGSEVTGVTLNETELTLEVGEGAKLWETVTPSTASDKSVTWSSDKPEVATVDESGNVEAKSAGEATITVTTNVGGKTATCKVTVVEKVVPVTGVTLDKTTLNLTEGEDATLVATVKPDDASNKAVTWSSDKPEIAKVDENGKVTAVKAGTAKITVTTKDGGKTATCTVTVKAKTVAVTGVSLDKTTLNMTVGEKVTLKATVAPSTASNKQVTWDSDKPEIATVNASGQVEAKAKGTAKITVTTKDGGKTATCTVTVKEATVSVTGVTLDKTTLDMLIGDKVILTATVSPSTATNKEVTWSSNATGVATVSADGQVEAKATGNATITVTTKDGNKTATCKVTVSEPTVELRTQFLEDKTTVATFGNVIHYKYGTNHRGTANEILVVPWDYKENNYVQDNVASHFSATSSNSSNVSVTVEDLGSRKAFCVKALKDPTTRAFSDLTFTYTNAGGTKITKTTRLVIAPSSAVSAFDYELYAPSYDISSGSASVVKKNSTDKYTASLYIKFKSVGSSVSDTKDMASYSWSSSNTSVVSIADHELTENKVPYPELTFKELGTSNVKYTYIDYKGGKLDKTIKFTVKKGYFDTGDYFAKNSSSTNRSYVNVGGLLTMYLRNSAGAAYSNDYIDGFTATSSSTSIATAECSGRSLNIKGVAPGNATVTVKGLDGKTEIIYVTVYKDITSISANSTTMVLGINNTYPYELKSGTDYTISPTDATYKGGKDFEYKSSNTSVVTVSEEGEVNGLAKGTATISGKPIRSLHTPNFRDLRKFEVVDQKLVLINTDPNSTNGNKDFYTNHIIYPAGSTLTMIKGDCLNFAFYKDKYSSDDAYRLKFTNHTMSYTGQTDITVVDCTSQKGSNFCWVTLKALKTGTAEVNFDLRGDDGYVETQIKVQVIDATTFPSGAFISFSSSNTGGSSALAVGQTAQFNIYSSSGSQLTGSSYWGVKWTSSDTSLATVDPATGSITKITGKKAGTVTLTATDSKGNKLTHTVIVYKPVTAISGKGDLRIGTNTDYQMALNQDYTVTPSDATYKAASNMVWKSSNTNYATVGERTGLVHVQNSGPATISVKPYYTFALNSYTDVRNLSVVWWTIKCRQSPDNTYFKSGDSYTSTSALTLKSGCDYQVAFYDITHDDFLTKNYYTYTNSNTSLLEVSVVNYAGGTTSNPIKVVRIYAVAGKTGTADFSMTYNSGSDYFTRSFQIKVVN